MDPLTIGLIAAGGLARGVGSGIGTLAAGNAAFGDAQEQRLRELRRMEEMNALGLTGDQRSALQSIALDPVQAASRERLIRQQALLGSTGAVQSGDALAGLMRQQDTEAKQLDRATNQVMAADLARQQQQQREITALEQAVSQKAASRQAAIGSFVSGLGGAADAAVQYQALQDATAQRNLAADAAIDPETMKLLESF